MRFIAYPSADGLIRKWFLRTAVGTVELEQQPRLAVKRDNPIEIELPASDGDELQVAAIVVLEDERHQPMAFSPVKE